MTEINLQTKIDFLDKIFLNSHDEYSDFLGALLTLYDNMRNMDAHSLTKAVIDQILEEYNYCSTNAKIVDKEVTRTYIETVVEWDE